MSCLLCNGDTALVLDLGETSLANELPSGGRPEKFPLRLVQCGKCKHLQIDHHVSPSRLYRHYVYVSNTSKSNRDYFQTYATQMQERFNPGFVVDVGGNDGLFASYFQDPARVLVVDPAHNIDCAVPRMTTFFDPDVAESIAKTQGSADLITCNNCFAHNADLVPMLRGVKTLLAPGGTFVVEVAYALPMLEQGLFDLIYHEHVHHWTARAAVPFLREHGLDVYDAERVQTHGGSIRFYARHVARGARPLSKGLPEIMRTEALDLDDAVRRFPDIVQTEREVAKRVLGARENVNLLGYPAKACTLLSYWGVGHDMRRVYDDNPLKIGKPTHFGQAIRSTRDVPEGDLLVASWNYADELKARFPKSQLFIPHPFRTR